MLVLTRKLGESIAIDDHIKIVVVQIKGKQVRLGIKAPKETKRFLKRVNSSGVEWEHPHKPKGMKSEASAINPSRWDK